MLRLSTVTSNKGYAFTGDMQAQSLDNMCHGNRGITGVSQQWLKKIALSPKMT